MNIKKGDTIQIISGKDKGKSGKVLRVVNPKSAVLLEGLNLFKKHARPKRQGEKGQTISLPRPLNVSKVMLLCPNCKKPARTGYRLEGGGKLKTRYCKKCQSAI